ncbi:hypothetical protein EST38_g8894 [Candolleomyces aberdarensis]|uniref:Aminoglycoside phosphotransferase domain-containing protein n=1 Tax=Candolleomyces aberdarensis TaxID=2316362 RepID=A0A4Q2DD53_9AGAR|nr:hypothetical protein EST38_g8894 [Candolleomyces aberdarensis]
MSESIDLLESYGLPSRTEIVAICQQGGYGCSGIPLRQHPDGPVLAWVKYGPSTSLAEATTQDWVSKTLNANPAQGVRAPRVFDAFLSPHPKLPRNIGYIVMEYIDLPDCDENDFKLVARAMNCLIELESPSSAPGPVGGGEAVNAFFPYWDSGLTYNSVRELEEHINLILKSREFHKKQVDLVAESGDRLLLCPCDVKPSKFKKGANGEVVALDFGLACFMPPAFLAFSNTTFNTPFAHKVARYVNYPTSDNVFPMSVASWFLVLYGKCDIALPKSMRLNRKSSAETIVAGR